ncbi:MAG: DUF58 domain-containing protein [Planctomycetota bacterium]
MPLIESRARLTTLMANETLSRLERLRLNTLRRFTNKSRGEHLAGKGGRSIDFSDYRDYVPGDDVRFVDWNIFSRLNRPYLKLYHQEEEMHVLILLDASTSMRYEEKFLRARELAAAFGVMGLLQGERVSVYAFHRRGEAPWRFPPSVGRANMRKLFAFLEGLESRGEATLDAAVDAALRHHFGRGVAVLLSDFLTAGDLQRACNRLFSNGLEIFALQILGPTEIDPEVTGDLRLVDSEIQSTLDISGAGELVEIYQDYRQAHERRVATLCRRRGGRFLSVSSATPLAELLFDQLQRRGWIR